MRRSVTVAPNLHRPQGRQGAVTSSHPPDWPMVEVAFGADVHTRYVTALTRSQGGDTPHPRPRGRW